MTSGFEDSATESRPWQRIQWPNPSRAGRPISLAHLSRRQLLQRASAESPTGRLAWATGIGASTRGRARWQRTERQRLGCNSSTQPPSSCTGRSAPTATPTAPNSTTPRCRRTPSGPKLSHKADRRPTRSQRNAGTSSSRRRSCPAFSYNPQTPPRIAACSSAS